MTARMCNDGDCPEAAFPHSPHGDVTSSEQYARALYMACIPFGWWLWL